MQQQMIDEEENIIEIPFEKERVEDQNSRIIEEGIIVDEQFDNIYIENKNDSNNNSQSEKINENIDRDISVNDYVNDVCNFSLPDKFSEIIDKILELIKHHLFILDQIRRLKNYNTPLYIVWRNQMNLLGIRDRYLLYGRLKQLKQLMNQLKQFSGCADYLFDSYDKESIIYRQTEQMIQKLQIDLQSLQDNDDIDFEIKNILTLQTSYCFNSAFHIVKQNKVLKIILLFILNIIDFSNYKKKNFDCKTCKLDDQQIPNVLKHIMNEHLNFLKFFNSSLGRCFDSKCKQHSGNYNNTKNYSAQNHLRKFHSAFYKIEKALRFIFNQKQCITYYGNNLNHICRDFQKDLDITIEYMPQVVKQKIQNFIKQCQQKGNKKYDYLKAILMNNIDNLKEKIEIKELHEFDIICIILKITWFKLCCSNENFNTFQLPKNYNFMPNMSNIYTLEFQEQIMTLIYQQNELISLYNRLLLGYYNNKITQNQLDQFVKDLEQFNSGIAFFNLIMNQKYNNFDSNCIFNKIYCENQFNSLKQCFDHYFQGHKGILYCLCNNECNESNILKKSLDQIYFHCHDHHKSTFKNLIVNYLKEQKLQYHFKASCFQCQFMIKTYSDSYWVNLDGSESQVLNFKIDQIQWSDLLYSYEQYQFVCNNSIINLQLQYQLAIEENLLNLKNEIAFNEKNQVAVCKKCKQKKLNKVRHLNKTQFENKNDKQIIPLARLCAKINSKTGKIDKFSYPHLIGNIYAQSKKALIFVEGTDILYSINMDCAKIREKFKLMGSNEFEREHVIKMCLHHHFLSNHCYKMASMSKLIIRQQEQLIILNKQLWRRYLELNQIQNVNDKMQLEFQKLQDLILFDDIMHRNQIYFIYQNFNINNQIFMSDLIDKLEQFVSLQQNKNRQSQSNNILQQLIIQFMNQDDDDQQFWKITLWLYLYCEQLNENINDSINDGLLESLIEYLIDTEIIMLFTRRYFLIYLQKLLNNKIHSLYIGVMYQIKFQFFCKKNQILTHNQENIIKFVFQTLAYQAIQSCNFNSNQTKINMEEINYDLLLQKQQLYKKKFRWLEYEILAEINVPQFIDMNCRIKLIKQAYDSCMHKIEVEEIIKSDIKWTIESAKQFIGCLKELKKHSIQQDKQLIKLHIQSLKPLEEEIGFYLNNQMPLQKQNFINCDSIQYILNDQINNQTQSVKNFEWIRKLHLVYFIPVEKKFQNMLKVHQQLRKIMETEPFYQINKYYNISSFQKEIEYAIFPNLYPKAEGGLITRAPNPKNMQLVIDIEQEEKKQALKYLNNIQEVREQNNQTAQKVTLEDLNNNIIYLNLELSDFTTKQRQGNQQLMPKKAIYNIQDEEALNNNLSFSYVYRWQYLSIYHYEKVRLLNNESQNDDFDWPQIINLKLKVNNDFLISSVLEKHVTSKLDEYLSKYQQQWDNEQKQYIQKLKNQSDQMKKLNKSKKEIESFIMEQEKLFIRNKIKKIIKNQNLENIAQQLTQIEKLEISSSSSIIESGEEEMQNKSEQNIQQIQRELRSKSDSVISEILEINEQEDNQQDSKNNQVQNKKDEFMKFQNEQQNLSEDTKFKLNCSYTKLFQQNVQWIFWRYYEWIKQKFFCYQFIVNNEKGTLLQNSQQIYHSIPPIQGTETYFSEEYNKLKTYCFNEGLPLLFLTITMNEFDEKTYKCMRGLNYQDLENSTIFEKLNKKNIRYDDILQNTNNFVDYYLFLMKHYKKVIKNKFQNQLNPRKEFNVYRYGLFGDYKAIVTRIEFQTRGSLHFHLFIFINQNNNHLYEEGYIQHLLGEFSLYNSNFKKDCQFLHQYDLFHHCSLERCITKDTQKCRLGFPKGINNGQYNVDGKIEIQQRRSKSDEQYVITFSRDTIKFFNSNCQINICNDENILGYLTKYINKIPKQLKNIVGKESASKQKQQELLETNSIMNHVKKYLDDKVTSLQEAYFAFKQTPIVESSFKVIKIKQQPMAVQISNKEDYQDYITVKNIEEMFEINQISNSWYRYTVEFQKRPEELEYLNFYEFQMTTIFYGKKQKYLMKLKQQISGQEQNLLDKIFFFDLNSNIIKLKEKTQKQKVIIQTSHLHPSKEYQGINNVYYLQMLQLYWPHRKNSWIQNTHDNYDGYKKAFENLINSFDYPKEDTIQNEFRKKYCKFSEYPFKWYVEQYNNLQKFQIRILDNLFKFNFNLNKFNQNYKNYIKVDYIQSLINQIYQQLDQELEYKRVDEIRTVIQYLDPKKKIDELCKFQINELINEIKKDVEIFWDQMSQITKSIIINIGLICKEYGQSELYDACPSKDSIQKYFPNKNSQQNEEIIYFQGFDQKEILSQVQDDQNSQDPYLYRNAITILEYEQQKVIKQIDWAGIELDNNTQTQWENLKQQQRLCIILMISNIIHNYSIEEEQRKINESTFIHGPGGVGKTFLIMFLIQFANNFRLNYNILCPTQQAVQNLRLICRSQNLDIINAQTIHSFFQLKYDQKISNLWQQFEDYLKFQGIKNFNYTTQIYQQIIRFQFQNRISIEKVIRDTDILFIEEISMIDPMFLSLLDIYSQISRRSSNQFGGIQVFIFGDSYQLQPVQEKQIHYFNSHIFKCNYFTQMIELTQPIRQQDDLDYFNNILLPLRKGIFHLNQIKFKEQIEHLKKRVIQINSIGPTPKIKQQLDQKYKNKEQIIHLFFTNESVDFENYKRAKKILDEYNSDINNQGNNLATYRKYIFQPIQFSFNKEQTDEELIILILGEKYQFKEQFIIQHQAYNNYYLMLPIGIRNFIAKQLGRKTHKFALKTKQFSKTIAQQEITLFKNAEIVIRRNIDKKRSIVNGQFAKITDTDFDIDFQSIKSMKQFIINKSDYIKENNLYNIIQEVKKLKKYTFSNQIFDEIKQLGIDKKLNNINFLMEKDISQDEKLNLYENGIMPRLQKIKLNVENVGLQNLKLYQKKFFSQIHINKQELESEIQYVIEQIEITIQQLNFCLGKPKKQQQEFFFKFLKNNNLIKLFYIDIINQNFGLNYLTQTLFNLKQIINEMPDQLIVYIHQIPISLGYARTIHTAQGSTIQNVVIDLEMTEQEQHGLLYTAMSRVRNLENLFFSGKFEKEKFQVRVNQNIDEFVKNNFIEAQQYLLDQNFSQLTEQKFDSVWKTSQKNASILRSISINTKQEQLKLKMYQNF